MPSQSVDQSIPRVYEYVLAVLRTISSLEYFSNILALVECCLNSYREERCKSPSKHNKALTDWSDAPMMITGFV